MSPTAAALPILEPTGLQTWNGGPMKHQEFEASDKDVEKAESIVPPNGYTIRLTPRILNDVAEGKVIFTSP